MSEPYFIQESPRCTCTGGKERLVPRAVMRAFVRMPKASSIRIGGGPTYHQERIQHCAVHGFFEVPA